MTLLLHQKEPFRIISGHCGDESPSFTLESAFWGPFLALKMAENFLLPVSSPPRSTVVTAGRREQFSKGVHFSGASYGVSF